MKELLQSIFKNTEDKIKNPFIGAFMTSWLVFNWKPIIFLLLSTKNVEDKIIYIEKSFSNIWFILFFPLISAFFYVLILPYLNLLFDELLKFSLYKRNNSIINQQKLTIENQKQLAIEEIKLEEAKTEFRERNTHNKLVEDLQKKNKEFEELIETERSKNLTTIDELKAEIAKRDEITSTELLNFERRNSESRSEIIHLTERMYDKDRRLQELTTLLNNESLKNKEFEKVIQNVESSNLTLIEDLKRQILKKEEIISHDKANYEIKDNKLVSEIAKLTRKISDDDRQIEELTPIFNNKNLEKNLMESLIRFGNNFEVLERYEGNKVIYIDNENKCLVSEKEVNDLMKKHPYKRYPLK